MSCPICKADLFGSSSTAKHLYRCSAHPFPHYEVEYKDLTSFQKIWERVGHDHGTVYLDHAKSETGMQKIPGGLKEGRKVPYLLSIEDAWNFATDVQIRDAFFQLDDSSDNSTRN